MAIQGAERVYLEAHGRDPEEEPLADLLARLRKELAAAGPAPGDRPPLPVGTYRPTHVRVSRRPRR